MAYVAPSTVTAGTSPITAAAHNIIVNDVISHEARMGLQSIVPTSVTVSSGSATTSTNGVVTYTSVLVNGTVLLNGVFSSAYTNYRIIVSSVAATSQCSNTFRLAASGTASSASDYFDNQLYLAANVVYGATVAASTLWGPNVSNRKNNYYTLDVMNPFLTVGTAYFSQTLQVDAAGTSGVNMTNTGFNKATTSYDGFQAISVNEGSSGVITVYGYNK